jgi:hypothetical protein
MSDDSRLAHRLAANRQNPPRVRLPPAVLARTTALRLRTPATALAARLTATPLLLRLRARCALLGMRSFLARSHLRPRLPAAATVEVLL